MVIMKYFSDMLILRNHFISIEILNKVSFLPVYPYTFFVQQFIFVLNNIYKYIS